MKKVLLLFVSLCICFSLYGCNKSGFETSNVTEKYSSLVSIYAESTASVNTGLLCDYKIAYSSADGSARATIMQPQSLAGISALIDAETAEITFEGVSVEMLLPGIPGFVPLSAFDGIVKDLKSYEPASYSFEKYGEIESVLLCFDKTTDEYKAEKRIYLELETLNVLGAEFYYNGSRVMTLDINILELT